MPITDVVAVAGGNAQAFALKSDGTVWGWGLDDTGGLGDGGHEDRLTPVQIPNLSNVVQIATGIDQTMIALERDGSVWVWGYNRTGQLGLGFRSEDPVTTPTLNPYVNDIKQVAEGDEFTYAVTRAGEVYGWGYNDSSYPVLGTDEYRPSTPRKIPGLSDVVKMAAGQQNGFALRADGVVFALGNDYYAGSGSLLRPSETPLPVAIISDVADVSVFSDVTYALVTRPEGD